MKRCAADQLLESIEDQREHDAVAGWLAEQRTGRTREEYAADLIAFTAYLDGRGVTLTDCRRLVLAQYSAHIRDTPSARTGRPLAASTVARRISTVSSFYRYAVGAGLLDQNPARDLTRPKVPKDGRTPARDRSDIVRMVAAVSGQDALLIAMLFGSALRISELLAADVEDFQEEQGMHVLAVRTKGGGRRMVQVGPIWPLVEAHIAERKQGPLFTDRRGRRMNGNQATTIMRRAARAARVANPDLIRPHVLRASAITHLLEVGEPIHQVQAMVGHDDPATTFRYWRRAAGMERDAALAARLSEGFLPVDNHSDDGTAA